MTQHPRKGGATGANKGIIRALVGEFESLSFLFPNCGLAEQELNRMKWQTRWALIGLLILGGYAVVLGGAWIARQHPRFTTTRVILPDGQMADHQQNATDNDLMWRAVATVIAVVGAACSVGGIGWALGRAVGRVWKRSNQRPQLTGDARDGE